LSLNWKEIDLVLSELDLPGSHVQKVRQPDYKTLILELYRPGRKLSLLVSLRQGATRLHEVTTTVENRVPLQRFAQLLRSRIQGGRIVEAEQIQGERIVRLTLNRGGETTFLFLRLWGGAANVIATDTGQRIIDAFYRRPNRNEVSGEVYDPEAQIEAGGKRRSKKDDEFTVRPYPENSSFNAAIEEEYRLKELREERDRLRKSAEAKLAKERSKIESTIEKLESSSGEADESRTYKEAGDLIMSNLYHMRKGMEWVEVENFYRDNEKTDISLDPTLTPQQNAEAYYEKYGKMKRAAEKVKDELASRRNELERLARTERWIDEAPDLETEVARLREVVELRKREKPKGGDEEIPGLRFRSGQFIILVGRNSRENDELLRRYAKGNDYWLHTRDFPGGFVFIRYISGKSVPLETLLDAGNLALYYSKGKDEGRGELYYTQVKYLRRAKEGKEGLVLPTQEKNLSVELDEGRLRRLFQGE
jgi:predicted ribosome quality control (RQC) complex YloA/Tae2 family protein